MKLIKTILLLAVLSYAAIVGVRFYKQHVINAQIQARQDYFANDLARKQARAAQIAKQYPLTTEADEAAAAQRWEAAKARVALPEQNASISGQGTFNVGNQPHR